MSNLMPVLAAAATTLAFGTPVAAAAASHATIVDCAGKTQQAPKSLTLFCGDGNDTLMGLRWSGWGSSKATAAATDEIDLCNPNCAAGHDQPFAVSVTATQLSGSATARYHDLTVTFTGRRPAGTPRVERWNLTARGPVTA